MTVANSFKHQLLIGNRSRQRAPNLTSVDRVVLGLATLFVRPHRLPKLGEFLASAPLMGLGNRDVARPVRAIGRGNLPLTGD